MKQGLLSFFVVILHVQLIGKWKLLTQKGLVADILIHEWRKSVFLFPFSPIAVALR